MVYFWRTRWKGLPVAVMNFCNCGGRYGPSGFCQSDGNGLRRSLCCMYEGVRSVRAAGYNTWTCTSDFLQDKIMEPEIRPDQTGVRAGVVLSVLVNLPLQHWKFSAREFLAS